MSHTSRIGLALLIAAVGCGEDATGPQAKYVVTAVSSQAQEGIVGSLAPEEPTVRVTDRAGNPVTNAEVRFDVFVETGGAAGSVARRIDTTNAQGIASAGEWTLSTMAGPNLIHVMTYGAITMVFRTDAKPDAPFLLGWLSDPENMIGLAGMTLAPPAVQVRDRFGNNIQGVVVSFAVRAGGGSLDGSPAISTDHGAFARAWTLGASIEPNTIRASALNLDPIDFTIRVVEPSAIYDLTMINGEPLDGSYVVSAFIALSADGHFVSQRYINSLGRLSTWTTSGVYELNGSEILLYYADGYNANGTLADGVLLLDLWTDEFHESWQYDIRN